MTFEISEQVPDYSRDLVTATIDKEAGILVYLLEELTDARLRCEQLKNYISQAFRLVSQSSHKDHFYEVAGDIITSIPETLFKLDKALAATALAASRLDYDELKEQLKPEKVEELEQVLRNVRIRQIDRRAPYLQPKLGAGMQIRELKNLQSALESIIMDTLDLKKDLPPEYKIRLDEIKDQAAKALKNLKVSSESNPTKQGSTMFKAASQDHLAGALRRIASGIEAGTISPKAASQRLQRVKMALAQTAQEAVQAMGDIQANSREEVMKGFKSANPALTDEQLEEIADQWEKNKDNFTKEASLKDIDKKVVDAFFDKKPLEGKMLSSDGFELEKLGMGGHILAKWVGGKIEVDKSLPQVKNDEDVLRYLKKSIPSKVLAPHSWWGKKEALEMK